MKDRLSKFMKNEGLSSSRFAEIMGIPPSNVSHLLSGRNKPGFEFLSRMMMRFPKLNPDWLILGTPPMYRPGTLQAEMERTELSAVENPKASVRPNEDKVHESGTTVATEEPAGLGSLLFPSDDDALHQPASIPASANTDDSPLSPPSRDENVLLENNQRQDVESPIQRVSTYQDQADRSQKPHTPSASESNIVEQPKAQGRPATGAAKAIDRIVFFFSDNTFASYYPDNKDNR